MEASDAYSCLVNSIKIDVGRFYSPGNRVGLGKGKLYCDVPYALYLEGDGAFATVSGLIYVMTHECDVDADNERVFSEELLICPVIPLDLLAEDLSEDLNEDQLRSFFSNLGARNVSRAIYIPPISEHLPFGGVLYLNRISHIHRSVFEEERHSPCAVTAYGLGEIEYALENHLLRPKAERLALSMG